MASVRFQVKTLMDKYEPEKVWCPICGKYNVKKLADSDRYGLDLNVVVCKNCDLIQVNPRLPQEFYNKFYEKYYRDLHQIKEKIGGIEDYFSWQYERAEKCWPEARDVKKSMFVLEIGCSAGGILQYFKDCGHKVKGIDLDKKYVEYGQKKGLDITVDTVKRWNLMKNRNM